jgi:hypothetical protein
MRGIATAATFAVVLGASGAALAQPASAMAPPPPPDQSTTGTTGYSTPPPYTPAPAPASTPRRSWFGTVGLGGMGYAGREVTPYDNGDKGSGILLEAVAGKWISDDVAIGGRLEAHTDDAEHYTDSSLTIVARFPVAAGGRFYLEPGIGIGFHNDEMDDEAQSGMAVTITGGYALTRKRFACDLRFGGAHYRIDDGDLDNYTHGLLWFGVALGFQ